MYKRLLLTIVPLLLFIIFGVYRVLAAESPEVLASESSKVIRVGVYENAPKVFTNANGQVAGLFPDILNYIASQENWEISYIHGTWTEGLSRLENGNIDIMLDVAVSEDRLKKI